MQTLKPDQKTMQFPSIGKVSRRIAKNSYKIDNEKDLIEYLDRMGDKEKVVVNKEVLNIRVAKKIIDDYVERGEEVPGVSIVVGEEGISVTFESKPIEPKKDNKDSKILKPKPDMDELAELKL